MFPVSTRLTGSSESRVMHRESDRSSVSPSSCVLQQGDSVQCIRRSCRTRHVCHLHFSWFTAPTVFSAIGLFFIYATRTSLTGRAPAISSSRYASLASMFRALCSHIVYNYGQALRICLAAASRIRLKIRTVTLKCIINYHIGIK